MIGTSRLTAVRNEWVSKIGPAHEAVQFNSHVLLEVLFVLFTLYFLAVEKTHTVLLKKKLKLRAGGTGSDLSRDCLGKMVLKGESGNARVG